MRIVHVARLTRHTIVMNHDGTPFHKWLAERSELKEEEKTARILAEDARSPPKAIHRDGGLGVPHVTSVGIPWERRRGTPQ